MAIALMFLALVPLAFLPDYLSGGEPDGNSSDDDASVDEAGLPDDQIDLASVPEPAPPVEAINPVDGANIDEPALADPPSDPSQILAPVVEDDVPADGNAGDPGGVLSPVDQIDGEQDTIWLRPGGNGGVGYSEIANFEPGIDTLQLIVEPNDAGDLPLLAVEMSQDGHDSLVFLDEDLVAILRGAPGATQDDIATIAAGAFS